MDIVLSQLFRNPAPWGDYDPFARRNFDLHRRIADEVTGNRFRRGRIESIIERLKDAGIAYKGDHSDPLWLDDGITAILNKI